MQVALNELHFDIEDVSLYMKKHVLLPVTVTKRVQLPVFPALTLEEQFTVVVPVMKDVVGCMVASHIKICIHIVSCI